MVAGVHRHGARIAISWPWVLRRLRVPVLELPPRPGLPPLDRIWIADGMEPNLRALAGVMAALIAGQAHVA